MACNLGLRSISVACTEEERERERKGGGPLLTVESRRAEKNVYSKTTLVFFFRISLSMHPWPVCRVPFLFSSSLIFSFLSVFGLCNLIQAISTTLSFFLFFFPKMNQSRRSNESSREPLISRTYFEEEEENIEAKKREKGDDDSPSLVNPREEGGGRRGTDSLSVQLPYF